MGGLLAFPKDYSLLTSEADSLRSIPKQKEKVTVGIITILVSMELQK